MSGASGDIAVHGGLGGTTAVLDQLAVTALMLRRAADLLDDAAASVRWAHDVGLGAPHGPPATRLVARDAVAGLARGPRSLADHADAVRTLGAAVDAAARTYARAEGWVDRLVRVLLAAAGHGAGQLPVLAALGTLVLARAALPAAALAAGVLLAGGHGPAVRRALLRTDHAELAVQGLAGFTRGLAPGRGAPTTTPVVGASGLLSVTTTLAGAAVPALRPRPLTVTPRLGAARDGPPPRGPADLLARVGALYPAAGGTAGTVGVDRLDHPDGTRGWVVAIPGTQDALSFGDAAAPMDMATNLRVTARVADDVSTLVTRALDLAGARPGEPVLLAGHSQGGMVAVALAGSPAFTRRHRVAAVLTAGSPVATQPVPPGTAALHLEHRQDLVPALDGWRNPDVPHRTTAVRDLAAAPGPVDRMTARSPGAAHAVDAYVRTARAVTVAGGPSVRGWERAAAQVLGGPGTTAVHHEFSGERLALSGPGPGSRP